MNNTERDAAIDDLSARLKALADLREVILSENNIVTNLASRVAAIEAELVKISGVPTKPEGSDVRNEENGTEDAGGQDVHQSSGTPA